MPWRHTRPAHPPNTGGRHIKRGCRRLAVRLPAGLPGAPLEMTLQWFHLAAHPCRLPRAVLAAGWLPP